MRELSATSSTWKRRGSSVVWDPRLWGLLLPSSASVSLRHALSWLDSGVPSSPPGSGPVLITGLQPCVELLEEEQAFQFLRLRVQNLILRLQDAWPTTALAFTMNCTHRDWRVDMSDYVYLKVRGGREVRFTLGLWNGVAPEAQMLMVPPDINGGREPIHGGYYVARFS